LVSAVTVITKILFGSNMRYFKYYFLTIAFSSIIFFSCSDIKDDITPPAEVKVHGSEVFQKSSPKFHGRQLVDGNMESCKQCHASDYSGGTAKTSCGAGCHSTITVHTANIMNPNSHEFHGKYIANLNWNMTNCNQCHGDDYTGGIVSPSCNTCHTQTAGPEACNTCHGDFTKPNSVAPPRALNSAISTDDPGVGAHQLHLSGITIGSNVLCNECHKIPGGFKSAGHIDDSPRAEVVFSGFASHQNVSGSYNFSDNKCSNTYCHGNFKFSKANSQYQEYFTEDYMVGNNYSPKWNKVDGTEAACGTCHGLPPKGHLEFELRSCGTCHQGVVDNRGNVIDASKHMNGKINVFNEEY